MTPKLQALPKFLVSSPYQPLPESDTPWISYPNYAARMSDTRNAMDHKPLQSLSASTFSHLSVVARLEKSRMVIEIRHLFQLIIDTYAVLLASLEAMQDSVDTHTARSIRS